MGSCNKKIICVRSLHFNLVANDKGSQNACSKYQTKKKLDLTIFQGRQCCRLCQEVVLSPQSLRPLVAS